MVLRQRRLPGTGQNPGHSKTQRSFRKRPSPKSSDEDNSPEETVALIRKLNVIPLDFQLAHSETADDCVTRSRDLLKSGSIEEASRLWGDLVAFAKTARLSDGTIDLADVWGKLRTRYQLKNRPNLDSSWQTLASLTRTYRDRIATHLPSGEVVPREREAERLLELLSSQSVTVVYGESGTGKSALERDEV